MPGALSMDTTPTNHGLTLIEVLVAMVILGVLAGGTLMVLLTAIQISKQAGLSQSTIFLAQQTTERLRNKIACRQLGEAASDTWYDGSPTCDPTPPVGVQTDVVTGATYEVTPVDCDGVGGPGDCLQLQVTKN